MLLRIRKRQLRIISILECQSTSGWLRLTNGAADIDDEKIWWKSKNYIRKVVERYKNSKAFDSWIL
ncbi:MAG: hypothetical protein ACRC0V_08065 [Fusobacteriaceae bacterium]